MIALDASVLIAHLNHLDAHHEPATALLRDAAVDELRVHGSTLAEVLVGGVRVGRGAAMRETSGRPGSGWRRRTTTNRCGWQSCGPAVG